MQSFIGSSIQQNNNLCHCWGLMTAHFQHPVWLLGRLHGERNACRPESCPAVETQPQKDLFLKTSCPSLYQELWQWKRAYCLHRDWWMKVLVVAGPFLYFLDLDGMFSFCIGETVGWKLSEANHHVQVREETLWQRWRVWWILVIVSAFIGGMYFCLQIRALEFMEKSGHLISTPFASRGCFYMPPRAHFLGHQDPKLLRKHQFLTLSSLRAPPPVLFSDPPGNCWLVPRNSYYHLHFCLLGSHRRLPGMVLCGNFNLESVCFCPVVF